MPPQSPSLSPFLVVLSLVNGMIGGLTLLLPVMTLTSGYLLALAIISITGFFSYYSCYLCIQHVHGQPDLSITIFQHFNNSSKIKIFYDICVWSSLLLIGFLYFQLITLQWQGLLGQSADKYINSILNAVVLVGIIFIMKYYQFGASLMAYGIISIVAYLIFLTWAVVDQDKSGQPTQPFVAFGGGAQDLTAAMGQAFAIQNFFIPFLKKNKNPQNYGRYVGIAYVIGTLAYFFIAFVGSYSILYRPCLALPGSQITIQSYFSYGTWQIHVIQIIYLIHLYSVFPQFMLISKKRIFDIFRLPQSHSKRINVHQIIYICIVLGICLAINLGNVSIRDIIDFNGAVAGFFFIYFIPVFLHIKCLYFSKGKVPVQNKPINDACKYQQMMQQGDKEINFDQKPDSVRSHKKSSSQVINAPQVYQQMKQTQIDQQMKQSNQPSNVQKQQPQQQRSCTLSDNNRFECNCDQKSYGTCSKVVNMLLMVMMLGLGTFVMVNGLMELSQE